MNLAAIDLAPLWIVAGIIMLTAELVVPGAYLMFLGAAAVLTGLFAYALDLGLIWEILFFAAAAVGSVYLGKRWFELYPILSSSPLLNERVAQMIGEIVVVVEPIEGGTGRVRVGDGVWPAGGPDAPVGTRMKVTGAEGNRLHVEPLTLADVTQPSFNRDRPLGGE